MKLYVIVNGSFEYSGYPCFSVWQSKFYKTREAAEKKLADIRAFGEFPGIFEIQEICDK